MDIKVNIAELDELLRRKIPGADYLENEIGLIFDALTKEYAPSAEIDHALNFIEKWNNALKEDSHKRDLNHNAMMRDIDEMVSNAEADIKAIKKGGKPINPPVENWQPPATWQAAADYTSVTELFDKLGVVMELYDFQKLAAKEVYRCHAKFASQVFILKLTKALIFVIGSVASYYIGMFCEAEFNVNKILVALLASLAGFYSSDKVLGKIKDTLMFKFSVKLIGRFKQTYIRFFLLKKSFVELTQKHPEILT
jgi:hypothetical protein